MAELLNITDKEGKVITFFDGAVSLSQIVIAILFIAGILLCFKIFSGAIKVIAVCILAIVLGINVGILSPERLHDVASVMHSSRSVQIKQYDKESKNIKVDGTIALVKLEGSWISIDDITSFSKGRKGSLTVNVGKKSYVTKDTTVVKFIKEFAK